MKRPGFKQLEEGLRSRQALQKLALALESKKEAEKIREERVQLHGAGGGGGGGSTGGGGGEAAGDVWPRRGE